MLAAMKMQEKVTLCSHKQAAMGGKPSAAQQALERWYLSCRCDGGHDPPEAHFQPVGWDLRRPLLQPSSGSSLSSSSRPLSCDRLLLHLMTWILGSLTVWLRYLFFIKGCVNIGPLV